MMVRAVSGGVDLFGTVSPVLAAVLKNAVIRFVGRYYSQDAAKALRADEARILGGDGIYVLSVYEDDPICGHYFNNAQGPADAVRAVEQARDAGQTGGSAICFAVEHDAQPGDYSVVADYTAAGRRHVRGSGCVEGAYGSGDVLAMLLGRGLIPTAWLAQSVGCGGYSEFLASGCGRFGRG